MQNLDLKTIIFIGRSGCGKGTQADLLVESLTKAGQAPVLYLETGERFRRFISGETFSSRQSREIMSGGDLQPSFLSIWMWANELIEKMTGDEHLIIDGSPRKLAEAWALDSALQFYKRDEPVVIHLNVSHDWAKERLLARGRADDTNLAKIEKRLAWFEAEVAPAIEFFRNHGGYKYLDINGERPIAEIHEEILKNL